VSTRTASRSRPDSGRNGAGFLKEDSGAYTIFAVIGFAMLMVIIGLVIDVGRVMNVHSQASSYADRIALAAAVELDGRPGALRRAVNAARSMPRGNRLTLSGDDTVGINRLVFMSKLNDYDPPPYTRTPFEDDRVVRQWRSGQSLPSQSDPANRSARYVMVETTQEKENYLFFNLAGKLTPDVAKSATVAPQAVAGFQRELCNSAPVMVCNPSESIRIGAAFNPSTNQQIRFDLKTSLWGARNYSLLDVDADANVLGIPVSINIRNLLGQQNPGAACYGNRVRSEGGLGLSLSVRADIRAGFNDRYDDNRRQFPVAIVNCREHLLELLAGLDVPVETYAQVRMTERININDVNVRLRLQFLGPVSSGLPQDNLREYPVLMR